MKFKLNELGLIDVQFTRPITESLNDQEGLGQFVIEGTAISEGTTSNGHVFLREELKKATGSLINVPLLKDHNNSVDSIVGRVLASQFISKSIQFRARVSDKNIQEQIRKGDLNTVSVGASVDPKDIEELDDGTIIPHNITFKELSMVAIPADESATFSIANSFDQGLMLMEMEIKPKIQKKEIKLKPKIEEKSKSKEVNMELEMSGEKLIEEKYKKILENVDKNFKKQKIEEKGLEIVYHSDGSASIVRESYGEQ